MGQDFLSTRIFIKFANYQQYAIMNILVMKKQLKLLLLTVLSVLSFTYTHAQSDIPFNINHGPYLQEVTADGASFNFTTSHPAFSFIELKQKGTPIPKPTIIPNMECMRPTIHFILSEQKN